MNFQEKAQTLVNYFRAGNFKKVIEGCIVINKKFPDNSFILNLSGMAYLELQRFHKAINLFELALKSDNSNIAAANNLANAYKHAGDFVRSDELFRKIIKSNPHYINAYNNYGNLKSTVNDFEGAIKLYEKTLELAKEKKINIVNHLITLAQAYQSCNNKEKAIENLNEALNIDPNNTSAHKTLSSIYKYSVDDAKTISQLSQMEQISLNSSLGDDEKRRISFAIGKAYDDLKDTEKAFKYFSSGNKLYKKTTKSNIVYEISLMNNIKKTFDNFDFSKSHKKYSTQKVIFILGMPRSGTTLVEQIISSHKKVYGAGEIGFLTNLVLQNFCEDSNINKQKIIDFQNFYLNKINDEYFDKLRLFNIKEPIITDKALFNFQWIGLIKIFFPNSKIINCKRNPHDNCLSIYKNNFSSNLMNWAYDEKEIADFYNSYNSLINFWNKKLPNFIHTVEYEKMVSDKDNEIKKILKYCELEWDNNCFNHHKNNKTPIKTVSISQAREPVYKSSVNSSDKYKKYLKEMFKNLI
jgi:tetratricopeptide (TPR) repeat protein